MKAWSLSRRNDIMNATLWTLQEILIYQVIAQVGNIFKIPKALKDTRMKLKLELKESFAQMKKSLPQGCPKAMDKVINQDSGWKKEQC